MSSVSAVVRRRWQILAVLASSSGLLAAVACVGDEATGIIPAENSDASAQNDAGGLPPGCDGSKDPRDEPCQIVDSAGVFVSPDGNDEQEGTKASPVRSIGKGIEKAKLANKRRVYVCEGTYSEAIVLDATANGIRLYGGFACGDFSITGARPRVEPDVPGIALRVSGHTAPTTIQEMDFAAKSATEPGASSVGVLVEQSSDVLFKRVRVFAGDGMSAGASGPAPTNHHDAGMNGSIGNERHCVCLNGSESKGGFGGTSASPNGQRGSAIPAPSLDGGVGGLTDNSHTCGGTTAYNGGDGANGEPQDGGAPSATFGVITGNGWEPASGLAGLPGRPGQGGGGGGYDSSDDELGGGGGCGSCGGAGGLGGAGGGASIAVLSLNSRVRFVEGELLTSNAGDGAGGGAGEGSKLGGLGATGTCHRGGNGGIGAGGSGGGGGPGGVSIGIAWHLGSAPSWDGATVDDATLLSRVTLGNAGEGGEGGAAAPAVSNGAAGRPGAQGTDGLRQAIYRAP